MFAMLEDLAACSVPLKSPLAADDASRDEVLIAIDRYTYLPAVLQSAQSARTYRIGSDFPIRKWRAWDE